MGLWLAAGILTAGSLASARADEVIYLARGSLWRYFRGLVEPSPGDIGAWREPGFADGSWEVGAAPFGYGDGPFGTDLAPLDPPMRNNYTTLYLRTLFAVEDRLSVSAISLRVDFDDAFIVWLNGVEVSRTNSPAGDAPPSNSLAAQGHESGSYDTFDLGDPGDALLEGTNVVAVQVFNVRLDSSDLKLDLEIVDPFGPDLTPPHVSGLSPAARTVVRLLSQIDVTFDEPVLGVTADDLVVNRLPATSVDGSGTGPWTFLFAAQPPGPVTVEWAVGHGITDTAPAANAFAGGSFGYTVDPNAPDSELRVDEILAANRSGLRDEDGDLNDWFEIVNLGSQTVDLAGVSASDDLDEPGKWVFPSQALGPGERLVVFASGKDRRPAGSGELHTSFQLNSDGEYFGIFSNDLPRRPLWEYAPRYPVQRGDISYGVDAVGTPGYLDPPTPGAPNGSSVVYDGVVAAPVSSVPRGFYAEEFLLELTSPTPGATIRYTLDGSEPTTVNGTVYTGPISVSGSAARAAVIIRAAAWRDGRLPSESVSFTYIFILHVPSQPAAPPGFPTSWSGAPGVDYAMDPRITQAPEYSTRLIQGLVALPTISLVMDIDDLFGSGGIYTNPTKSGVAWERPGSVELVYPDGRPGFQINCGVRIQGGASRRPDYSPKHSFRLLFKGAYGPTKLRFPIFPNSPVDTFDTIVLRAGFNNTWINRRGAQRRRGQYHRDQWARDSQIAMNGPSAHGIFAHLYVNGLYWGLYNPCERPSAPFAAEHLGGEKEDWDALNSNEAVDGDRGAWDQLLSIVRAGVTTPERLAQVEEYLALPHFIDYMLMNLCAGTGDWPSHNWYSVRPRVPGGQFRFIAWDTEWIFEDDPTVNRIGVANDNSPGIIWTRLRGNTEFRRLVGDHAQRHLFHDGALTPAKIRERWMRHADDLRSPVVAESARWGDYRQTVHSWFDGPYDLYTLNTHYIPEENRILSNWFPQRTSTLISQLRSAGLYPSIGAPIFSQHGGPVEAGYELMLTFPTGVTGTIWYTIDGTDPRIPFTGEVAATAMPYAAPIRIDDAVLLNVRIQRGSEWSALETVTFHVPGRAAALRISEIHYHPSGENNTEFLELWNAGGTTLDLTGAAFSDGITFIFPGGSVLLPGGRLVIAANARDYWVRYPGAPLTGQYVGRLDNGGEEISIVDPLGNRLLELEFDDEDDWPLAADGHGWSLVLRDADLDPQRPSSWRASSDRGGSPGAPDPPPTVEDLVVLNEVLSRPEGGSEAAVELRNLADHPADVGGWWIGGAREPEAALKAFRIPAGTVLAPGGFAVFEGPALQAAGLEIAPSGGELWLSSADAAGDLTGHVHARRFRAASSGVPFGIFSTSVADDFTALTAPSLGLENPEPTVGPVVINEIHYHPGAGGDLSAIGLIEFLELRNLDAARVALHDAALGRGCRVHGVLDERGTDDWEFPPGASIPAKSFALVVPVDPAFFRSLRGVPAAVPVFGPTSGRLDNSGETLRLERPERIAGEIAYVTVDRVSFRDDPPWPTLADGGGPSLEKLRPELYGNEPLAWRDSLITAGTPGSINTVADPATHVDPRARFEFANAEFSRTLVFDASGSSDADGVITDWSWDFDDGETSSGELVEHEFPAAGQYLVSLTVTDDDGDTDNVKELVEVTGDGSQIPGDGNQDGELDLSDAVFLLEWLFSATPPDTPCASDAGTIMLLDLNGDTEVDVSDAIFTLVWLYRAGAREPALGTECVLTPGCPDVCEP